MSLLDDFVVRALIAGIGVALAAGPLGCLVLWRRMIYFGDATAHASILGVALALASGVPVLAGVLIAALAMGALVTRAGGWGLQADTLLGVGAHAGLALGLIAVAFVPGARIDLEAYLFGDILAVAKSDLALIWAGAAIVAALIAWRWPRLLTATLNADLATADGHDPEREKLILTLGLAVLVAAAIKVVGALLITAMLIVPAAAARTLARTPEGMAMLASLTGVAAVLAGLGASLEQDLPAGPAIVVAAVVLMAAMAALGRLVRR